MLSRWLFASSLDEAMLARGKLTQRWTQRWTQKGGPKSVAERRTHAWTETLPKCVGNIEKHEFQKLPKKPGPKSAQKSTSIGSAEELTSSSKVVSERLMMAPAMVIRAFLVTGRVWGVFYTAGTPMRTRVVVNDPIA